MYLCRVCFRSKSHTQCTDSSTSLIPFLCEFPLYSSSLSTNTTEWLKPKAMWHYTSCQLRQPALTQSNKCLPISHGESEAKPHFDSIRREGEREREASVTLLNFFIFQSSLTHPSALQMETQINTRPKLVHLVMRNTRKTHSIWFSRAQLKFSTFSFIRESLIVCNLVCARFCKLKSQ